MAPADVHPTMNDPFAAFGATQQQQPQQPGNVDPWAGMNNGQQPANGMNQQNDPFAGTVNGPSSNDVPLQSQPSAPVENACDPWAMNGQNQNVNVPHTQMPPAPMPSNDPFAMNIQVHPNTMMPAQEQSVPTTVVCNDETSNSPPSPIGDQSVTGGAMAGGPEVPTFNGYQQPPHNPTMMPIQEQPVLSQNVNPFDMSQPVIPQNPPVPMPATQGQMNVSTNPFGTMDLTGSMNNLSMQGTANEQETKDMAANGIVVPTDNQAPIAYQEAGTNNVVPPMAPPPASQPPAPPSEPSMMPPPQPFGMMAPQAPLSPTDDPFAVYPPVVSPGIALSPQVNDPFGYAFSPMTSPTEGQRGNLASMPTTVPDMPFTGSSVGAEDPFTTQQQAVVPSNAVANDDPFGVFGSSNTQQQAVVPSNTANDDPFGVFGNVAPPAPADPFGSSDINNSNAVVSSNQVDDDPFGVFAASPVEQPSQQPSAAPAQDPWAAAGFNEVSQASLLSASTDDEDEAPIELDTNGLPKQGDYYEARINARSLGAMFYTARDLENTLLYNMPTNVIDSLKSRPIVAYVTENSAAYNAGVHLGHCILSINGTEVSDPDECADVIRNASRPMNIRGYVMPELEVSLAEGKHTVKYDKKEMRAPSSTLEWKEKYVVVGGIVAKPFVLNMYRSKVSSWLLDKASNDFSYC